MVELKNAEMQEKQNASLQQQQLGKSISDVLQLDIDILGGNETDIIADNVQMGVTYAYNDFGNGHIHHKVTD